MAANPTPERTCFQTAAPYADDLAVQADVAIVYGADESFAARAASWRERGYGIHLMTGVAWGNYQDYLYGKFDGREHLDEAQTRRDGERISHGGDVYYMVPTDSYARMLAPRVCRAIDEGADAVHLEEPEFWVDGGYSPAFRAEWERFYGKPGQPPHSSAEAQYLASKLKHYLYRRCLAYVFAEAKKHGASRGRAVKCYVPTHSLLNYAHWGIVSPGSSLADIPDCDGFIGQVWTGTARTPNLYGGVARSRTFETAFLEYGYFASLARATGKRTWFLADPVEDDPNHSWDDYRRNYIATITASLLHTAVSRYEIMPWPARVFRGEYPLAEGGQQKGRMPPEYATTLLCVIHALNDMGGQAVSAENEGVRAGVMVSDAMMFQRGDPSPSDPNGLYGLALPLLKAGVRVEPLPMEFAHRRGYLNRYSVILMSYDFMKPPGEKAHKALAAWVRRGGRLLFFSGDDPYAAVPEWWNTAPLRFSRPQEHLWQALGLGYAPQPGMHRVGKGRVLIANRGPASFAHEAGGSDDLLSLVRAAAVKFEPTNRLLARRGNYLVAACMGESVPGGITVEGPGGCWLVDLLDPRLRPVRRKIVSPGEQALLRVVNGKSRGDIVACASRVTRLRRSGGWMSMVLSGPKGTPGAARLALPARPKSVRGPADLKWEWHEPSHTLLLLYANNPEGSAIELGY